MSTVTITEEPLALEALLAVVDGAQVELAGGARAAIAAGRAVVDRALARNDAVYGLTTQVGHGKDTRMTEDEIRGEQMFLVKSHSGGIRAAAAGVSRPRGPCHRTGPARGGRGGCRGGALDGGDCGQPIDPASRRRAS
jgi:histidine ammonia-lyase